MIAKGGTFKFVMDQDGTRRKGEGLRLSREELDRRGSGCLVLPHPVFCHIWHFATCSILPNPEFCLLIPAKCGAAESSPASSSELHSAARPIPLATTLIPTIWDARIRAL